MDKTFTGKAPYNGNKPGIEPSIQLYKVGDVTKKEDGVVVLTMIIMDQIHPGTKLNLVNKVLSAIYYFDHSVAAMALAMQALKTEMYEILVLNSTLDIDQRHRYLKHNPEGASRGKFKSDLC